MIGFVAGLCALSILPTTPALPLAVNAGAYTLTAVGGLPGVAAEWLAPALAGCGRPVIEGRSGNPSEALDLPNAASVSAEMRAVAAAAGIDVARPNAAGVDEEPTPDALGITFIRDITASPEDLVGEPVLVAGEYAGIEPYDESPLQGVRRSAGMDWILRDATGEIFLTEATDTPMEVTLDPAYSKGRRVKVTGVVRASGNGTPYIQPTGVYRWRGERGAFCGLEKVEEEEALPDVGIGIRLIFVNDTDSPITLMYPAGIDHDVIVSRDGVEVWRLSRSSMPLGSWGQVEVLPQRPMAGEPPSAVERPTLSRSGAPFPRGGRDQDWRATWHQDGAPNVWPQERSSSRVYVDYWAFVDNDGNPVEAGVYEIQGVISRRIFSYPLRFRVEPQ